MNVTTYFDTDATQGHINSVNLLLETNASFTRITKNYGKTIWYPAARMDHVEVITIE
jgi:ankyrin repeat protein